MPSGPRAIDEEIQSFLNTKKNLIMKCCTLYVLYEMRVRLVVIKKMSFRNKSKNQIDSWHVGRSDKCRSTCLFINILIKVGIYEATETFCFGFDCKQPRSVSGSPGAANKAASICFYLCYEEERGFLRRRSRLNLKCRRCAVINITTPTSRRQHVEARRSSSFLYRIAFEISSLIWKHYNLFFLARLLSLFLSRKWK
jgi:hypothetical protein